MIKYSNQCSVQPYQNKEHPKFWRNIKNQTKLSKITWSCCTSIKIGSKRKLAFAILGETIDNLKQLDTNGCNPNVDDALSSLSGIMFWEK